MKKESHTHLGWPEGEKKRSLGRDYHPLCLKCHKCKRLLTAGQHAEHDEKPYCTNCYMRDFGPRGNRIPVRTFNTPA
ncbi:cysteine-rich protein 2-like isoform X2 [Myxocyprinus asiaticus]|uniref:cysteine-rich protein 2-like isoform X2 n=1 Tax=Myxocyprinus asiaticus TaxID=70543 RepID=UPI0022233716|nr:cysteine-rich protein 2-like isoform X2 [Myxocyprinus asiaticus]